ncbi:hypothetical protein PIB30_085206 [Stylosanthes scabra]|uniref:CCHC-type domain-containing protein n=1 Tax=Stylosanthes scabra TaxID=79078 RepID=A0ABU6RT68_9FABA|nr:hypothetical protein [Stylosanthes scabra]
MTILDTQGGENKKKSLALKASSHEEDSDENEDQDEEFALLLKRFNKFAKKKNFNFKNKNKAPKCYECGEVGHIKPNCPKLQKGEKHKKFKKKKKAYISWENEDETSFESDDDEVANLFLMASEEKMRLGAKKSRWFVDSGCSKHMTGDAKSFTNFK